jgi:hypothetical protein
LLEQLETRELLALATGTALPAERPTRHALAHASEASLARAARQAIERGAGQARSAHPNLLVGRRPAGPFLNPKVIQQIAELLYGPNSPTPMTPTPAEVKRQTLTARFIGQYTVGPPTFSDRASTIHVWSKDGGSDAFLKGKLNMVLFPPADPGASPTPGNPYANQVTGFVDLIPQNFLQSSGQLGLDLNSTPGAGSNPRALPTHLGWTVDTGAGIGAFSVEALFTQGAGVLDIKWIPDAHPLAGTEGSGKVILTFQGLINYSQIANPVSVFYG